MPTSGRHSLILMQKNNSMFFVCFISLIYSSEFEEILMGKLGNIIKTRHSVAVFNNRSSQVDDIGMPLVYDAGI